MVRVNSLEEQIDTCGIFKEVTDEPETSCNHKGIFKSSALKLTIGSDK